jgi:hypothetical protein
VLDTAFDLADCLFLGIVAGWGLAVVCGQDRIGLSPRWISASLGLFALAGSLASFGAMDQTAAVHFAIRSAGLAVLYLYLHRSIDAGRFAPATLAIWLVPGLALNGLLAIAQTVHQNPVGLAWLGEPNMLRTTPGTAVVLVHGTRLLRAFGILPHANVLGGLLAAALPFAVGLLLHPSAAGSAAMVRRIRGSGAMRDLLLLLSAALLLAGIILSFSRSAWLGLLCGGIYLIVRRSIGKRNAILGPSTRRGLLVAAGIGLLVVGLLVAERGAVSVRLQPGSNPLERFSIQQRLSLLEQSFKVISWRPLTGVGGNNFALAAQQFMPPDQRGPAYDYPVHNTYLLAQAELGPLGAVTWLALMLVPVLDVPLHRPRPRPARAARLPGPPRTAPPADDMSAWMQWQLLAGCSLTVVAVAGLFDFYIWVNEPVAVLWVVALALFTASTCRARCLQSPTQI